MHELGLTERILEVALERAAAAGAGRISEVQLEVGEDSGIDPDAITLHWPIVSARTIAAGAALRIDRVPPPATIRVVAIDVDPDVLPGA